MNQAIDQIAILVVSCDRYADLWAPFFQQFRRFWPDCPFATYLLSNHQAAALPGVRPVLVGDDVSWSDNLRKALTKMSEDYVLLFLDDLFLVNSVVNPRVLEIFRWATQSKANCVRLNAGPKPDKPCNELLGMASPGTIYRTSTVLTLWNRQTLLALLKPGETAWDFEIYGSIRSDLLDGFYATWVPCFPVVNGVIKGKWQSSAVKVLRAQGAELDLSRRAAMGIGETLKLRALVIRAALLKALVPPAYRRRVKHLLLRGKYRYQPSASH